MQSQWLATAGERTQIDMADFTGRDERLDHLMNWIVGTLLVLGVAVLVVVQAHPPV
jgi:hypothetical protein